VTTHNASHPLELAADPERHLGLVSLIVDLLACQHLCLCNGNPIHHSYRFSVLGTDGITQFRV
jgi:hypothetical protein